MPRNIEQDKAWVRDGRQRATVILNELARAYSWAAEAADCGLPAALAPEALTGDHAGITAEELAAVVTLANSLNALLTAPGANDAPSGRALLNLIKSP